MRGYDTEETSLEFELTLVVFIPIQFKIVTGDD
jgi:hypothetical protein